MSKRGTRNARFQSALNRERRGESSFRHGKQKEQRMDHVVNESLDVNATRQVLKAARLELESVAETIKMLSQHPTLTPGLLTLQMGAAAHLLRGVLQTVEFMSMHPTQLGVAQPNRESA